MANQMIQNPQGEDTISKLDLLTGKYTKDVIVGILILSFLATLIFANIPEKISDRLLDGMLALIGFFAGSKFKSS
jgi:hypothetical protein